MIRRLIRRVTTACLWSQVRFQQSDSVVTHYALVHDVDNTAEIIAAGDATFCAHWLQAWVEAHPLTDTQTGEVVARTRSSS